MKTLLRNCVILLSLGVASIGYAAGGSVDVMVADANGKAVFKGKTNVGGNFATGKLPPGDYSVQFNSSALPKQNYALVLSAGKQKVMAEAVSSEKFAKGGVAMRIQVPKDTNITGVLTSGKPGNVASSANSKIKIMNGIKYVWVPAETGSNIGGRWVEEGSASARNTTRLGKEGVQNMQDRGSQGGIPGN